MENECIICEDRPAEEGDVVCEQCREECAPRFGDEVLDEIADHYRALEDDDDYES